MNLCSECPRSCAAEREALPKGFCRADRGLNIASITLHRGEEPPISGPRGIANIFFAGCNMRCRFCQNHQISRRPELARQARFEKKGEAVREVERLLDAGARSVGFVSPSHLSHAVRSLIVDIRAAGRRPVFVLNTNAYDRPETIADLSREIDVFLPDFKYSDPALGRKLSATPNYPAVALEAIREMIRRAGIALELDDEGAARRGVLVRHLVLPGHVENSIESLRLLAREFTPALPLSLMSQYYPAAESSSLSHLDRRLAPAEYEEALDEMKRLGFENGWTQELESHAVYRPDFVREQPFSFS